MAEVNMDLYAELGRALVRQAETSRVSRQVALIASHLFAKWAIRLLLSRPSKAPASLRSFYLGPAIMEAPKRNAVSG